MNPTMELRWVERKSIKEEKAMGGDYYRSYIETSRILQQKWVESPAWAKKLGTPEEEWRDIPLENEFGL